MSDTRNKQRNTTTHPAHISRRDFIRVAGTAALGTLAAGCAPKQTPTPTQALTAAPTSSVKPKVAIGRAATYDRALIKSQMQAMMDGLGGLSDIIPSGGKVVIKTNLTGGNNFQAPAGFTPITSWVTHPEVVRAVGELARDAGAGQIYIVEAVYDAQSYPDWGYVEIANDLNATLIDLNQPAPYESFVNLPVGEGSFIYDKFMVNQILQDADTFISVAKMKCHYNAGVTLSMKNLVGMVPYMLYNANPSDWWRSALHGDDAGYRLPRIILDLNRARPIHLAVIDGVMTGEGGEAPRGSFKAVQPGALVAGKNALSTDAVSAAVMSFDPTADQPTPPFLRADNYLNLGNDLGLGTNKLEQIEVVGASIEDVRYEFGPAYTMSYKYQPNQPFAPRS